MMWTGVCLWLVGVLVVALIILFNAHRHRWVYGHNGHDMDYEEPCKYCKFRRCVGCGETQQFYNRWDAGSGWWSITKQLAEEKLEKAHSDCEAYRVKARKYREAYNG